MGSCTIMAGCDAMSFHHEGCPEAYQEKENRRQVKTYFHESNGRRCIYIRGKWFHWDHDHLPREPGPREVVDYECRMDHYIAKTRTGTLISDAERAEAFGFPGIGHSQVWMIDDHGLSTDWPGPQRRITHEGVEVDYGEQGYNITATTELARRILAKHAPEALEHFLKRNAEYGDDNDFNLGVAGQYVDISRKVQKLKRRWWDHRPARDGEEDDRTVVMELIGHLLMAMDMLEGGDRAQEEVKVESTRD